jgi:folate-binding protein YgfZ
MSDDRATGEDVMLTDMGVLGIGGSDARAFLQGQLSNDLLRLTPDHPLLAAFNTPQGRVIAILQLLQQQESIFAIVPMGLLPKLLTGLQRYVLRSKVTLSDRSARLAVVGRLNRNARQLSLVARTESSSERAADSDPEAANERWRLAAIAAGQPQIYPETSEMFVAQMLNLDLIDGISFSKGCYTGQEIIARTQHRGRIKRRMLRYRVRGAAALKRGEQARLESQRIGRIVEIAARSPREIEILAVVPLDTTERQPDADSLPQLDAERLPLPYDVPDLH